MIVWSNGAPVLLDDKVHAYSSDLSADYGSANSIADMRATSGGMIDTNPDVIWKTQPWVRTVIEFLAGALAQTRIHSYQMVGPEGKDRDRVTDSPLAKLLRRPNPGPVTGYDWRHHLVVDRAKWGRYACHITNVAGGDDGWRLTRIPPRHWSFIYNGFDEPVGLQFTDGRKQSLERTLFYDGYPSSEKSPMDVIASMLLEEQESASARRDMWKNGPRTNLIVKRPLDAPDWTPGARNNFRRSLKNYGRGQKNAGHSPIFEDGMEPEVIKPMSFADAEQNQARTLNRREVMAFFHVAAQLVGDVDGTNHSNVTAYNELVHVVTLGKWYMELEEGFADRLTPVVAPAGDEFAEFNVKSHMRLAFEKQAEADAKALAGVPSVAVNEVRRRNNQKPFPNPIFDEPIIPINIRPPLDSPSTPTPES